MAYNNRTGLRIQRPYKTTIYNIITKRVQRDEFSSIREVEVLSIRRALPQESLEVLQRFVLVLVYRILLLFSFVTSALSQRVPYRLFTLPSDLGVLLGPQSLTLRVILGVQIVYLRVQDIPMPLSPLSQLFCIIASSSSHPAALIDLTARHFPLHTSLRLSYRPIPSSSAPSDIPLVHNITLKQIPGHLDIQGNEKADILAKKGAKNQQSNSYIKVSLTNIRRGLN